MGAPGDDAGGAERAGIADGDHAGIGGTAVGAELEAAGEAVGVGKQQRAATDLGHLAAAADGTADGGHSACDVETKVVGTEGEVAVHRKAVGAGAAADPLLGRAEGDVGADRQHTAGAAVENNSGGGVTATRSVLSVAEEGRAVQGQRVAGGNGDVVGRVGGDIVDRDAADGEVAAESERLVALHVDLVEIERVTGAERSRRVDQTRDGCPTARQVQVVSVVYLVERGGVKL